MRLKMNNKKSKVGGKEERFDWSRRLDFADRVHF